MQSIRTYDGDIRICGSCGQPAYFDAELGGPSHFIEQWDGVYCLHFPLTGKCVVIPWNDFSLKTLKEQYPDTSGGAFPARAAAERSRRLHPEF